MYNFKTLLKMCFYYLKSRNNQVVIVDTPTHGNLGDHAIVMAEKQFLKQYTNKIIELTAGDINNAESSYAALTPRNQIILVHGGGFLGELWPDEEERFRRILQSFDKQKVVVFPQTVTFDMDTEEGRKYFEISHKIYASHPNLTIFVRETKSYNFMKKYMPEVHIELVPDIVTSMQINMNKQSRKGILFCMRADKEKNVTDKENEQLYTFIQNKYIGEQISYTDTVLDHFIRASERENYVNEKLIQFSKAKLVVTDRLHGMIFAALTNTPCIALGNSNGKVKGVYEWIKNLEYISYVDNIDEFMNEVNKLDIDKGYQYDYKSISEKFMTLHKELKEIIIE